MKIKYIGLSCLAAAIILASLFLLVEIPLANSETSIDASSHTWIDQFDSPALNARWTILREDPSHWSLTDRPDYLRITTQPGGLFSNSQLNVLLADPTLDAFVITTKVDITPVENVQGAYIHVYQDDDNYIYVGRRYANGDLISFRRELDSVMDTISLPETATTVYLRLTKWGDLYLGAYSTDGTNWTEIGKLYAVFNDPQVGVGASNGPAESEIPADFDYFQFDAFNPDTHYVSPGGNCGGPTPCYGSIQAAVDAASDLDLIKVSAGTYTGVHTRPRHDTVHTGVVTQTVYISKSLEIQGGFTTGNWNTPDPAANPTIVDAQDQGRVFYVTGDAYPTIGGLHITGGDATGLHGEEHGDNDAGGGLYIITATATIHDNQIYDNHGPGGQGGGLFLQFSDSIIEANAVYSNTAGNGGGLGAEGGGSVHSWGWTIRDNEIRDNEAGGGGGIGTIFNSGGTIAGNTIAGNKGGGLALFVSSLLIKDNLITDNYANDPGGGLSFLGDSESTLVNNVITDNKSDHDSSAIHAVGVDLHLIHNTIARNTPAQKNAIGVEPWTCCGGPSTVVMTNTILADSDVGIKVASGNTVTVDSILWYNVPKTIDAETNAEVTVQNQFTGDPAFALDGYHLTVNSAALNKGIDAGVAEDIDGDPRPFGDGFELGADELVKYIYLPTLLK